MRDHRLKKLLDKIEQRGRTAKQLTEDKDGCVGASSSCGMHRRAHDACPACARTK